MTPTQRSLAMLREAGYLCAIVEHWNYFAKIRQDHFGFGDILAVDPTTNTTVIVQTTSGSNFAARRTKIRENKNVPLWLQAGNQIHIHGWGKVKPRGEKRPNWECRIEDILDGQKRRS